MRNGFLITLVIFSCSVLCADYPERTGTLSSKVILQNTSGYFVLSDRSCWKAIGFATRWRTVSEWWNNVQLVPERYECIPNDWYLGTQIEVYSKYNNLEVSEANATNQEALKQCTHLLLNTRTGKVLFAVALEPAECIVQLFNEAYADGHDEGFTQGRLKSYQNATEIYNNGHAEGYKVGYAEGFRAAMNNGQAGN